MCASVYLYLLATSNSSMRSRVSPTGGPGKMLTSDRSTTSIPFVFENSMSIRLAVLISVVARAIRE